MASFLEVLLQMFIVTLIIWIWEWMQLEAEEVYIDNDNEKKTTRGPSLRKIIIRRRRNKKKLFAKQLKLLISFMKKIQQGINSSSLPTEDEPITDHRLIKDVPKNEMSVADITFTESIEPIADKRLTRPPVADINTEKSNEAADKQRLIQDTLEEDSNVTITVEADETITDCNIQPKMITFAPKKCPEAFSNPEKFTASSQETEAQGKRSNTLQGSFLTDKEIATGLLYQPKGPRSLVKWEYFDDDNNNDFKLDEGTGWDLHDMYATNAEKFNYKTTLDDDLSEYTTVLVLEDTEEDRLRWERACRLADEIQREDAQLIVERGQQIQITLNRTGINTNKHDEADIKVIQNKETKFTGWHLLSHCEIYFCMFVMSLICMFSS